MELASLLSRIGRVVPQRTRERIAPLVPFTRTAKLSRFLRASSQDLARPLSLARFGQGMSERAVEIPWALSRYHGDRVVLEVGHAHALPPYVELLRRLKIPELHGLDLVRGPHKEFIQTVGDIRRAPYRDEFFDLVFCVSTVEHVGQDNSGYGTNGVDKNDGDFTAMREIHRILKPGGRAIVTVPFGAPRDYGWQIQYDASRLDQLIAAAPFEAVAVEYFGYDNGWTRQGREALAKAEYGVNASHAAAVACIELRRKTRT